VLRENSIVHARREGTSIFYSLASPKIAEACALVRGMLEENLARNHELAGLLKDTSK
jgi:DNA-binding transcriptional ArsR family regulator